MYSAVLLADLLRCLRMLYTFFIGLDIRYNVCFCVKDVVNPHDRLDQGFLFSFFLYSIRIRGKIIIIPFPVKSVDIFE